MQSIKIDYYSDGQCRWKDDRARQESLSSDERPLVCVDVGMVAERRQRTKLAVEPHRRQSRAGGSESARMKYADRIHELRMPLPPLC